jgi:hypothetical protein
VASQAETEARKAWGADKSAAFDRALAAFWDRAAELAKSHEGADPALHTRISRGTLSEVRLDRDERFA